MLMPIYRRERWRDVPLLTVSIVAVNCFAYCITNGFEPDAVAAIGFRTPSSGSIVYVLLSSPSDWGRLLSHTLVHTSILHLAINCWLLLFFGSWIEQTVGTIRTGLLYISGSAGAVILHLMVVSRHNQCLIGSSGAVAALIAFACLQRPMTWIWTIWMIGWIPVPVQVPSILFYVIYLVMDLVGGWSSPTGGTDSVAFWAHVGGSLAGMTCFQIITAQSNPRPTDGVPKSNALLFDARSRVSSVLSALLHTVRETGVGFLRSLRRH